MGTAAVNRRRAGLEKVLCVRAVSCRRKVSNHKSSPAWPRLESSASGGRRPDHRCLLASAVRPRPVEEGTTRFEKQMFLVFRLFPSKNGKRAHRMLEPMNREKKERNDEPYRWNGSIQEARIWIRSRQRRKGSTEARKINDPAAAIALTVQCRTQMKHPKVTSGYQMVGEPQVAAKAIGFDFEPLSNASKKRRARRGEKKSSRQVVCVPTMETENRNATHTQLLEISRPSRPPDRGFKCLVLRSLGPPRSTRPSREPGKTR